MADWRAPSLAMTFTPAGSSWVVRALLSMTRTLDSLASTLAATTTGGFDPSAVIS